MARIMFSLVGARRLSQSFMPFGGSSVRRYMSDERHLALRESRVHDERHRRSREHLVDKCGLCRSTGDVKRLV